MDSPLVGRVRFPSSLTAVAPSRWNAGSGGGGRDDGDKDDDDDACTSFPKKNLYSRKAQNDDDDDDDDDDQSSVDLLAMDTEDEEDTEDEDESNDKDEHGPTTTKRGGDDDDDNNNNNNNNNNNTESNPVAAQNRPAIDDGHLLAEEMSRSSLLGTQGSHGRQQQQQQQQQHRQGSAMKLQSSSSSSSSSLLPMLLPPTPATKTLNDLSQDPSLSQLWYRRQSHDETSGTLASASPLASGQLVPTLSRRNPSSTTKKDDYAPDSEHEDDEEDATDAMRADNHPRDDGAALAPSLNAAQPPSSSSPSSPSRPLRASEGRDIVNDSTRPSATASAGPAAAAPPTKGRKRFRLRVVQVDPASLRTVGTYESLRKAEDETGIRRSRISEAARSNGTKKAGAYYWRYEDDDDANAALTACIETHKLLKPPPPAAAQEAAATPAALAVPVPVAPPAAATTTAAAAAAAAAAAGDAPAPLAGGTLRCAPRTEPSPASVQHLAAGTIAPPGLACPTRGSATTSVPAAGNGGAASPQPRIPARAETEESPHAGSAISAPDDRPAGAGAARGGSATADVPFCALCATGRGRVHHAWCPHHPQFHLSGAPSILDRLVLGAGRLGCDTCRNEYQQGSRTGMAHSFRCREYTAAHVAAAAPPNEPVAYSNLDAANGHSQSQRKPRNNGRSARSTRTSRHRAGRDREEEEEYEAPATEDDDDSAMSCDSDDDPNDSMDRTQSKGTRAPEAARKPKQRPTSRRRTIKPAAAAKSAKRGTRSRAITPNAGEFNDHDSDGDEDDDEDDSAAILVEWKECENPWGPDEYQDGDVILFSGNTPGVAHIETLLPSKRFVVDPFVGTTPYRATHHAPQEGFQVVQLRRDPMARLDWGFRATVHEFGGACLVTAVDPVSPASSAVRETTMHAFGPIYSFECLTARVNCIAMPGVLGGIHRNVRRRGSSGE
jgi:hypothetical protein